MAEIEPTAAPTVASGIPATGVLQAIEHATGIEVGASSSSKWELEPLALKAFAFQYDALAPFRTLCDRRGVTPDSIESWQQMPPIPTRAFAELELSTAEPQEVFRSSGTTSGDRSTHYHPFPGIYRAVIDATFPAHCLAHLDGAHVRGLDILSLIPSRETLPDSSLGFMADHILERYGSEQSTTLFGPSGVDVRGARSWLGARQRAGRPILLLAASFALVDLLDGLERLGLRFRLPPGSVLFDTGGTKGKSRAIEREDLIGRVGEELGVPPSHIVREYGMTELTSHFYTQVLRGGDSNRFYPHPWTRVRTLDPATLDETAPGEPGLLAILDLANIGSAVHVLTEDLGVLDEGGFRLLGRAEGADLRGCSLTIEEMASR